jgi:hypothetical protein
MMPPAGTRLRQLPDILICDEPLPPGSREGVVPDPGRPEDDLSTAPGAAAGGPAPEGGTASSASAKVPSGRLAPRRQGRPPRGINATGLARDSRCSGFGVTW